MAQKLNWSYGSTHLLGSIRSKKFFLQYDKELPFSYLFTKFEVQPLSRKCLNSAFSKGNNLKALPERQASSVVFYENIKIAPKKKQYLNAYNSAFLLGKDTLNSLF